VTAGKACDTKSLLLLRIDSLQFNTLERETNRRRNGARDQKFKSKRVIKVDLLRRPMQVQVWGVELTQLMTPT
jgi:hypothetical protein